jgi:hypothetical protein
MILIVLTVVFVGLLIGVLAIFLFMIGVLLNRIADNLDDCLQNVKKIAVQAEVIIPDVARINQTGGVVAGALPLLVGGAEAVTAKLVPPKAPEAPKTPVNAASAAVPTGVGYLDS